MTAKRLGLVLAGLMFCSLGRTYADVPAQINFQGRVEVPVSEQRRSTQAAAHSQAPFPSPRRNA
jgi:hypothetical protein